MSETHHFDHQGTPLAYRFHPGAGPLLVFLPGYMSDMAGTKATALMDWAITQGRACLLLDYSGCGASGGDFLSGSISRWTADAAALVAHVLPEAPVTLVGSSMGGWIALRLGEQLGSRLAGLVGIAPAPDFTDWGLHPSPKEQAALAAQGWFARPSGYGGDYRYSRALIEDAPNCRLLNRRIAITAPVRLLHGQADDAVPWHLSLDIAERLDSPDVQVLLIKAGDHRLSGDKEIALMLELVDTL
jgi:pimeloyl-ACP methyl ester carboxylesterase